MQPREIEIHLRLFINELDFLDALDKAVDESENLNLCIESAKIDINACKASIKTFLKEKYLSKHALNPRFSLEFIQILYIYFIKNPNPKQKGGGREKGHAQKIFEKLYELTELNKDKILIIPTLSEVILFFNKDIKMPLNKQIKKKFGKTIFPSKKDNKKLPDQNVRLIIEKSSISENKNEPSTNNLNSQNIIHNNPSFIINNYDICNTSISIQSQNNYSTIELKLKKLYENIDINSVIEKLCKKNNFNEFFLQKIFYIDNITLSNRLGKLSDLSDLYLNKIEKKYILENFDNTFYSVYFVLKIIGLVKFLLDHHCLEILNYIFNNETRHNNNPMAILIERTKKQLGNILINNQNAPHNTYTDLTLAPNRDVNYYFYNIYRHPSESHLNSYNTIELSNSYQNELKPDDNTNVPMDVKLILTNIKNLPVSLCPFSDEEVNLNSSLNKNKLPPLPTYKLITPPKNSFIQKKIKVTSTSLVNTFSHSFYTKNKNPFFTDLSQKMQKTFHKNLGLWPLDEQDILLNLTRIYCSKVSRLSDEISQVMILSFIKNPYDVEKCFSRLEKNNITRFPLEDQYIREWFFETRKKFFEICFFQKLQEALEKNISHFISPSTVFWKEWFKNQYCRLISETNIPNKLIQIVILSCINDITEENFLEKIKETLPEQIIPDDMLCDALTIEYRQIKLSLLEKKWHLTKEKEENEPIENNNFRTKNYLKRHSQEENNIPFKKPRYS